MRSRASAIIIDHQHILLIHRIRDNKDFYAFPGGKIEAGESAEEACIREVWEETGLHTAWLSAAFDYPGPWRMEHYFFVQPKPGELALYGPELQEQSAENQHIPEWIPLAQVSQLMIKPQAVQAALAMVLAQTDTIVAAADLALYREPLEEFLRKAVLD